MTQANGKEQSRRKRRGSCDTTKPGTSAGRIPAKVVNARASVTAGLKCAPEIGPKVKIRVINIAPVANVLASRAMAILPPANFSPMIPEPTTAARRNAVPRHSATMRRERVIRKKPISGAATRRAAGRCGFVCSNKGADKLVSHLSGQRIDVEAPMR